MSTILFARNEDMLSFACFAKKLEKSKRTSGVTSDNVIYSACPAIVQLNPNPSNGELCAVSMRQSFGTIQPVAFQEAGYAIRALTAGL
jgi:hypothetical protein